MIRIFLFYYNNPINLFMKKKLGIYNRKKNDVYNIINLQKLYMIYYSL